VGIHIFIALPEGGDETKCFSGYGAVVILRSKQNRVVGRHKMKDHPKEIVRVKIKLHGSEA